MEKCGKGLTSDDIQSPVGIPLDQDTPLTARKQPVIADSDFSPVSHGGNPGLQGSHRVPLTNPSPLGKKYVKDGSPLVPLTYPSPVGKRLMGITSNARNDIYMKTLLNSPYHQTYSLMSAAPSGSGPMYNAPVHTDHEKLENAQPLTTCTPQGTKPPHSGTRKFVTPKHTIINPFDNGVDDLHLPAYMSPGFFTVSTPASEKIFSWAIEHIAELNPADIDEMPVHQVHSVMPDKETEARAQRAIDQFFASNLIVPSPWSDPRMGKRKYILPVTPESLGSGGIYSGEMIEDLQGSIQKSLPTKEGMEDACCQTVLSLPVDFDIQNVLGNYMTQGGGNGDEGNQQDMLSTSSLRRKLFFHGDTSSLAPSPVKGMSRDIQSEFGSPMLRNQTPSKWEHVLSLKNTPAFSSSPIKSVGSPSQYRRCSSNPEFLASPDLSPIVTGNLPKSSRKSRSSGLFDDHQEGFDSPEGDHRGSVCGSRVDPLSPIPFEQLSNIDQHKENFDGSPEFTSPNLNGSPRFTHPNFDGNPGFSHPNFECSPGFSHPNFDGGPRFSRPNFDGSPGFSCPNFDGSPGFSPIRPPKTPIRKILRKSQEESYIQEEACQSADENFDSITPISSNPRQTTTSLTSVVQLSPIQKVKRKYISSVKAKSHSCRDLQKSQMDFEAALNPSDHVLTSSLCDTVDFSDATDFTEDTQLRTRSSSNQDTGYQTASLQSTRQESVTLHTNLTNQFSSLPFNLTNQDVASQNSSYLHTSQEKPPVLNLTHQFSLIANQQDSGDEHVETHLTKPLNTQNLQAFQMRRLFLSDNFDLDNTPKEKVVSRLNFENSAFPGDADTSADLMEIDLKHDIDGDEEVMFRAQWHDNGDEEVKFHAHCALARTNSIYPQEHKKHFRNLGAGDLVPQNLSKRLIQGDFVKDKLGQGDFVKDKLGHGDFVKDKLCHGDFVKDKLGQSDFVKDKLGHGDFVKDKLGQGDFIKDKLGQGDFVKDKLSQGDFVKDKQPSGSELAYSILKRAGEDLARYDTFMTGRKATELSCRGLHRIGHHLP